MGKKIKSIIWGVGGTTIDFLQKKIMYHDFEIVCFTDNNSNLWGKTFHNNLPIVSPDELCKIDYDIVIICSLYFKEIKEQLINDLEVPEDKIITFKDIEKKICAQLIEKYKDNEEEDIVNVLKEYKTGDLHILGSYHPPITKFSEVFRDENGFPYIMFLGKKMFFPKNHKFNKRNGKEIVEDILYEQGSESPHRYIPDNFCMPDNSIIVDAGVCEGNFSLRYIEKAKKIYLIEVDELWMEALKKTFAPYRDKVVFCNKFLSGRDNGSEITLDTLVKENIDFIKMDIEGAEVDALLGGKEILSKSKAQCAICSYHRQYDEKYIAHILRSYGYITAHSKGYMFFPYDDNMIDTIDLRRGVVYGVKR